MKVKMPLIKRFNRIKSKLKVQSEGSKLLILVDVVAYTGLFLIGEPLK